jgi:protein-S-isoprenylcysteine O-methyltransferase Ste14
MGMADRREQVEAGSFVAGQVLLVLALLAPPASWLWRVPLAARVAGLCASAVGLAGMLVAASSLGKGLTPSPLPNSAAQLRTGGIYGRVRHPLYSFLLLFAAGRVVGSSSPVRPVAFLALTVLLTRKARWEERRLGERFPGYAAYAARTPRFVPRGRPVRSDAGRAVAPAS